MATVIFLFGAPLGLILVPVATSITVTLWAHYDSFIADRPLGVDQGMLMLFAWPITFPYYAFRSRGLRSGGLLVFISLVIIFLALIAGWATGIAVMMGIAYVSV